MIYKKVSIKVIKANQAHISNLKLNRKEKLTYNLNLVESIRWKITKVFWNVILLKIYNLSKSMKWIQLRLHQWMRSKSNGQGKTKFCLFSIFLSIKMCVTQIQLLTQAEKEKGRLRLLIRDKCIRNQLALSPTICMYA